jgi:hypothetical protein
MIKRLKPLSIRERRSIKNASSLLTISNISLVHIKHSSRDTKKYEAMLTYIQSGKQKHKTVHFGASGYEDYTQHGDKTRRERYLKRHRTREDWTNPLTAGFWSRWLLWGEYKSMQRNIFHVRQRFNL